MKFWILGINKRTCCMDLMLVVLNYVLALRLKGGFGWKHSVIQNRRGAW